MSEAADLSGVSADSRRVPVQSMRCVSDESSYTRFSMPGRGCCIGTGGSVLLACWASCNTGMLHSGHTFLTSNHLMRHLGGRKELEISGMLYVHFSINLLQTPFKDTRSERYRSATASDEYCLLALCDNVCVDLPFTARVTISLHLEMRV